jgi:geranylgeranyl diphosphate synthase type I
VPIAVDLERRLAELGELIDGWTRDELAKGISHAAAPFGGMLEYHLGWRDEQLQRLTRPAPAGKKLRPALALLVCEAVSGSIEPARPAAVAIELVHNFSLVHDDIQDRGELRRHRPALWRVWGVEQGINAGDALFALAQVALLRQPTALAAGMAAELNRACVLLAEGQYLDIALQRGTLPVSLEAYQAMITRKTGGLFACAARLGSMAAEAAPAIQEAYARFGLELGLAFQEQDDLLGVWGRAEDTGKPAAADVVERKRGLPAAVALSRADAPAWLREVFSSSTSGQDGAVPEPTVARVIAHFDALNLRADLEARVTSRYQAALAALEAARPREPAHGYLAAMCERLGSRTA